MAPLDRRVRDHRAGGVPHDRREGLHIAGVHGAPVGTPHDLERGAGELAHPDAQHAGHALERGLDPDGSRRHPAHVPEFVHLGAGRVARPPCELGGRPMRPVGVQRGRAVGHRAALEDGPVRGDFDPRHRRPLDHHRDRELEGAAAGPRPHRRDDDLPFADLQRGDGGLGAAGGGGGGGSSRAGSTRAGGPTQARRVPLQRERPPRAGDPHRFVDEPALGVEHPHDERGGRAALEHQAGRIGFEPRRGLGGEGGGDEDRQRRDRDEGEQGGCGCPVAGGAANGRESGLGLHCDWSSWLLRTRSAPAGLPGVRAKR